jgi:transcriptional regulator with XRE-family HTH domain
MSNIGPRIKKIRKQKNKTLAEVAGEQLSVSMLSLIENNKSRPSIETLRYIAGRLNIDFSDLILEESDQTKELWTQVEKIINDNGFNIPEKINDLISPNIEKISNSLDGAKLFKAYAYLQVIYNNQVLSLRYIKKAEEIYYSHGLINQVVETWIDIAMFLFASGKYKQSLEMLTDIKMKVDDNNYLSNYLPIKIKLLYLLGSMQAAIGNYLESKSFLDEASDLCSSNGDFSLANDIYKLRLVLCIFEKDITNYEVYIQRLELLNKITNKVDITFSLYFSKMTYEYLISKDPLRILGLFADYNYKPPQYEDKSLKDIHNNYIYLMVGIAYFHLKEHEKALDYFKLIKNNQLFANHPIDISMRSEVEAYKSLIYLSKGNIEKAMEYSEIAMSRTKDFQDNPYKLFIKKTYESIRKEGKKSRNYKKEDGVL